MRRGILLVLALLAVTACGGGDTAAEDTTTTAAADTTTSTTSAPDTTAPGDTTTTAAAAGAGVLQVRDGYLVDGEGRSLYLFLPDEQGESTCYDQCAENWPPLEGEVEPGEGVDPALVGSIARDDGTNQVTYNGWPLYYFAADFEPGETNGQGLNDVWFLVTAEGEVFRTAEEEPTGYDY